MRFFFAAFGFVYITAAAFYMLMTRNIGTPFMDKVKEDPELLRIKEDSKAKRKDIFMKGVAVGLALLYVYRAQILS